MELQVTNDMIKLYGKRDLADRLDISVNTLKYWMLQGRVSQPKYQDSSRQRLQYWDKEGVESVLKNIKDKVWERRVND